MYNEQNQFRLQLGKDKKKKEAILDHGDRTPPYQIRKQNSVSLSAINLAGPFQSNSWSLQTWLREVQNPQHKNWQRYSKSVDKETSWLAEGIKTDQRRIIVQYHMETKPYMYMD